MMSFPFEYSPVNYLDYRRIQGLNNLLLSENCVNL